MLWLWVHLALISFLTLETGIYRHLQDCSELKFSFLVLLWDFPFSVPAACFLNEQPPGRSLAFDVHPGTWCVPQHAPSPRRSFPLLFPRHPAMGSTSLHSPTIQFNTIEFYSIVFYSILHCFGQLWPALWLQLSSGSLKDVVYSIHSILLIGFAWFMGGEGKAIFTLRCFKPTPFLELSSLSSVSTSVPGYFSLVTLARFFFFSNL